MSRRSSRTRSQRGLPLYEWKLGRGHSAQVLRLRLYVSSRRRRTQKAPGPGCPSASPGPELGDTCRSGMMPKASARFRAGATHYRDGAEPAIARGDRRPLLALSGNASAGRAPPWQSGDASRSGPQRTELPSQAPGQRSEALSPLSSSCDLRQYRRTGRSPMKHRQAARSFWTFTERKAAVTVWIHTDHGVMCPAMKSVLQVLRTSRSLARTHVRQLGQVLKEPLNSWSQGQTTGRLLRLAPSLQAPRAGAGRYPSRTACGPTCIPFRITTPAR